MIKAVINQLHLPERCTCVHHNKIYFESRLNHKFLDLNDMVNNLIRWNKSQGKDACWIYELVEITKEY